MSTLDTAYVIVARPLHPKPEWPGHHDWQPVGFAESLEEAWAGLDLIKEHEREQLHPTDGSETPHEREYDVWTVPAVKF